MFLFTFCVLLCTIFILIYQYFQRSFDYWPKRRVPHLKTSFPFGNYNRKLITDNGIIIRDIYCELRKTGAQFGGFNMLTLPVFIPLHPELYKEMLIKNFNCFQDLVMSFDEEIDPMAAILALLNGTKWRFMRSKLSPSFSISKLKGMFPLMVESSTQISNYLEKSDKLDIHDLASRFTADVICSCGFGIESNSLKDQNAEFVKYGNKLSHMNLIDSLRLACAMFFPGIIKMFKVRMFNPEITNFFYNVVKETIEYREKNDIRKNDLMDSLIRLKNNQSIDGEGVNINDEGLTLEQIAAQVFFFFIAGFETTAVTLTCCLYLLAKNPEIQEKVRGEILQVLKENNDELTFEAVQKMTYADLVLQETLRMYPAVIMLNRVCTEDFRIPKTGIVIEKGTRVALSTLGVHYDPEYYPEPHIFNPERFTEKEKAKRPDMTYFPFGDGPRICLGYRFATIELKIALVQFLRGTRLNLHPSMKQDVEIRSYSNLLGLKDKIYLVPTKI